MRREHEQVGPGVRRVQVRPGAGPGEADPVYPSDIDRMFISLVAPGYSSASSAAFSAAVTGWAELSAMRCSGHRPMLTIGDVMVPPHGIGIATGYDDGYNQTPARLLRTIICCDWPT